MQARVTLRRAALTIFGLIAVLPILLFTFFMWRFERLHQTEAQVGVLLAVFFYVESHRESPMLPLSFFRIPTFSAANVVAAAVFFAMFG